MIGTTLSHYRIVARLGAGGMGVVYRAHDENLDRDVALKILSAGDVATPDARERFRREALALSRINHPHIATIHDFSHQQDVDFLVMELVEGPTLADRIAGGVLEERRSSRSPPKSPRRSRPRTNAAWCTAISSPRT